MRKGVFNIATVGTVHHSSRQVLVKHSRTTTVRHHRNDYFRPLFFHRQWQTAVT